MKTASLPALVAALMLFAAVMAAPVPAATFTLSNSTGIPGTLEIATREVDGLKITYPVDEADVVELLLPTIAEFRAARKIYAKREVDAILEQLSSGSLQDQFRALIMRRLALPSVDKRAFASRYDAGVKDVAEFLSQWQKWSGDLGIVNFWNNATGEAFKKGERFVFPEISYELDVAAGKTNFSVTPPYLNQHLGLEFLHSPAKASEARAALKSFRLDLPLFYSPGESAEHLAAKQRELIEMLATLLPTQVPKLAASIYQSLIELLLQEEIKADFSTAAASAAPGSAMLVRGLARYYLFASLKISGKITGDNEAQMLSRLVYFDLLEGPAAGAEFLRAFESLDPFSEKLPLAKAHTDFLFLAGSRLATLTLLKLAQGGPDSGLPVFSKLRNLDRVPPIGFKSATEFAEALEAAYPGKVQNAFLTARSELVAAVKSKLATAVPKAEAPPKPTAKVAPLPDREAQVFDGVTITHPAVLRDAIRLLGPELAAQIKNARTRVGKRFDRKLVPPIPITDGTLEIVRKTGLQVTRERADFFASQAALLANSSHLLLRMFEGDTVQVWFRDDLKALLKEGREVPGFSDTSTDKVSFDYALSAHRSFGPDQPLTIEAFKKALASQPAPVYPIILQDRSIGELEDAAAQVKLIRDANGSIGPFLEAAETATPAQLGMPQGELAPGGLLTPAQALFSSVHELVETELIARVIASPDRRWFCEGVANFLAMRACDEQFGSTSENNGHKVFESLFDPASSEKRVAEIDLAAWPAVGHPAALMMDAELTVAHYYFATRVLLAATEGRGDDFLKSWIAKIRETPWNRTNAVTITAAYDTLTGGSLREMLKRTTPSPP